jgi:hypothetical protein
MAIGGTTLEKALARYVGLRGAWQMLTASGVPLSEVTIKHYADTGRLRSIRDPQGRRLILREDIERLATERGGAVKASEKQRDRSPATAPAPEGPPMRLESTTSVATLPPSGGVPHPLRAPCRHCGCVDGTVRQVGVHQRVDCVGCGRYQYFAPQGPPTELERWTQPKAITGTYEGATDQATRMARAPLRMHRVHCGDRTALFWGTQGLNAQLAPLARGTVVTIRYTGTTRTASGHDFKLFTVEQIPSSTCIHVVAPASERSLGARHD